MKITGIKKAVGIYNYAKSMGVYSPIYANIMLNRSTGKIWADEFCDSGRNSWVEYEDKAIISLSSILKARGIKVNMANVKAIAQQLIEGVA